MESKNSLSFSVPCFSPDILQFFQHLATSEVHAEAQVCSSYFLSFRYYYSLLNTIGMSQCIAIKLKL